MPPRSTDTKRQHATGRSAPAASEQVLPVVPLRETVLFPRMLAPLVITRQASLDAVDEAIRGGSTILLVAQKDEAVEEVGARDLYRIGTEATIGRALRMPDGTSSLLVQGERRVRVRRFVPGPGYLRARVEPLSEPQRKDLAAEATMRAVLALFEKCVKLSPSLPEDAYIAALNVSEPGWLADLIAATVPLSVRDRQGILGILDPLERLQHVSIRLARELDVLDLEASIHTAVQKEVDKSQREYYLREQMKAIQRELGQADQHVIQSAQLQERIANAGLNPEAEKKAREEVERLALIPPGSPEIGVIRGYLDWLLALPWHQQTIDNLDIAHARQVLDLHHFGLERVKERVLEYIAVRKLAGDQPRSPILCLVGPPGVGKTSLGRSMAEALGRRFVRISLGGVRDQAEIRGHRRTYIGSMPGRILQTMRAAGVTNPLFMLDEIDKMGTDFRGDPAAALLEVLDREQNSAFSDHYLEVPYDLSRVLFVTTANVLDPIPAALRDRLEAISLPGYTEDDKVHIAHHFLLPRQIAEHGLAASSPTVPDRSLRALIRGFTREAGVRNLDREIGSICRKLARSIAEGKRTPREIGPTQIERLLGPPRFLDADDDRQPDIGVGTGLAWTAAGGETMAIEVTLMEGRGNLILTGQLGEVMRESAQAALSFARTQARQLGYGPTRFNDLDIHVHVPAGGIPKDGPSAGITIATALVSALSGQPVRGDLAMTGEITLRGRVLPVGGIKEKVLAAHRAGVRTVLVPRGNRKDLREIPLQLRKRLTLHAVGSMQEVLGFALPPAGAGLPEIPGSTPVAALTLPGGHASAGPDR